MYKSMERDLLTSQYTIHLYDDDDGYVQFKPADTHIRKQPVPPALKLKLEYIMHLSHISSIDI